MTDPSCTFRMAESPNNPLQPPSEPRIILKPDLRQVRSQLNGRTLGVTANGSNRHIDRSAT
jgi:hypothetical protein